jgi:hypothetical protein
MFSEMVMMEKKDACYYKVKASAKVWPSAYASGRLVQCRKKGAGNYGNKSEGVAEGLNEFAQDGFNGGNDNEGFSPEIAKMAQEDGFTKGASLADGATLERAMTINHWHSQHGGMYKQYFAKGFKQGRMNKIRHDNKQYNLNLKLMKDGSIRHGEQGMAEELGEEFDLIENIVENLADRNGVDAEMIWEDLESLSDDELYVFAVTSEPIMESEAWQKANKRDKTDGMSQKAVNSYRREHPGSKLKTAVTTKPSKLKKGSKASKRRKSYCSRSRGQMKMHSISCAKTPDKAICKARRRWNC